LGGPCQNFGFLGYNAFDPTNNWPVRSLSLRKISKIGLVPTDVRF